MKKLIFVLMLLLFVGMVRAEKIDVNFTVSLTTINTSSGPGRFNLNVDGVDWGSGWCDGQDQISPKVSVLRSMDCADVARGSVDTLAEDMRKFVHYFNDTRIALFENYANCQQDLKNCQVSNEFKVELMKDCNGTSSDWYKEFQETQSQLQSCQQKECILPSYVEQIKKDNESQRWWYIGGTAAAVGGIAYGLYFRKGLAKNAYHKV